MRDSTASMLTDRICSSASVGGLDTDRLNEIVLEYAETTGVGFRGTITVTEDLQVAKYTCGISVGTFGSPEVPSVMKSEFSMPSGNKFSVTICSYPEQKTGDLISEFRDERGFFVRSAMHGKWVFDRYTGGSQNYAVYVCLASCLSQNVDLIIDNNEVYVREGDDLDTEVRIRTKEELTQYLLKRTYEC